MLLKAIALFASFLPLLVRAQTSTASSSSTPASTSPAPTTTHTISVGADGLNFSPNQVNASVGDIIEFRFFPQNHSVARAAFGSEPCIPYEDTGNGRIGFWSGFRPIATVSPDPPIFRLPINDTEPVFFYCSAPQACLDGMVGVINPNSTFTYAQQFAYTQNATLQFSPLEYFPPEVSSISRTTTATGAPTGVVVPQAPTATTTSNTISPTAAAKPSSSGLSTGAIVGIALGGFALAFLIGAVLYMCGRQRTVKEILRNSTNGNVDYQPSGSNMSEAKYPNVMTTPRSNDGSWVGHDDGSYRSMSPPVDERTSMMGVVSPGSPPYAAPGHQAMSEVESTGMRPFNPSEFAATRTNGPHELAAPVVQPQHYPETRPFSFTPGEDMKN